MRKSQLIKTDAPGFVKAQSNSLEGQESTTLEHSLQSNNKNQEQERLKWEASARKASMISFCVFT